TEQLGAPLVHWQHLFQGLKFSEATGLGYVRNRDYSPSLGRFIELDPIGFRAGDNNWYRFLGNNPCSHVDPSGLEEECVCGPDISKAIVSHLNDFISQAQGDLNPILYFSRNDLIGPARKNGPAFRKAAQEITECPSQPCKGTYTLGDMCISGYHIDHILIMAYISASYGETSARSAGEYNESFWLGFVYEGSEFVGSSNLVSNADLTFNEVALCFARHMKHKDANGGITDNLTHDELIQCTHAVSAQQRATIAKKPGVSSTTTDYENCKPCNKEVAKPKNLQLPPIDI
ncbi:MAG: RHS repeat-associated core domain-containing protein, partial [Bacteroidota bacterium]